MYIVQSQVYYLQQNHSPTHSSGSWLSTQGGHNVNVRVIVIFAIYG